MFFALCLVISLISLFNKWLSHISGSVGIERPALVPCFALAEPYSASSPAEAIKAD